MQGVYTLMFFILTYSGGITGWAVAIRLSNRMFAHEMYDLFGAEFVDFLSFHRESFIVVEMSFWASKDTRGPPDIYLWRGNWVPKFANRWHTVVGLFSVSLRPARIIDNCFCDFRCRSPMCS